MAELPFPRIGVRIADPALANETGLYYDKCRPKEPSAAAKDEALAKELWSRSDEWTQSFR